MNEWEMGMVDVGLASQVGFLDGLSWDEIPFELHLDCFLELQE